MKAPENFGDLDYGLTNFDNILYSFIVLMQCITIEGWTQALYNLRSTTNSAFATIVFILLVLIGNNFFLNLMLAVLWTKFDESQLELKEERRALRTIRKEQHLLRRQQLMAQKSKQRNWLKQLCYSVANSTTLNIVVILCVIINAITLALDGYPSMYLFLYNSKCLKITSMRNNQFLFNSCFYSRNADQDVWIRLYIVLA